MTAQRPPIVDLIIPARNEQENIAALIAALPIDRLRHVVLVNNGSTDDTAQRAREGGLTVVDEPRRGYGAACLAGLAWIASRSKEPDIIAFVDADLADDPGRVPQLCEPITRCQMDLVIGARRALAEPGSLTVVQHLGNALACGLIRLITGRRYTDLGPMRAIRWSSLQALGMTDQTWGWTVEMQFKAAMGRLRVLEINTPYRRRHAGCSKISGTVVGSIHAGWKILATIAVLWWQSRRQRSPSTTRPCAARPRRGILIRDAYTIRR